MAKEKPEIQRPTYWARVPAEVRYDASLPAGARLLYGEIDALSRKKGYCWASNKKLAEWFGVSTDTISRWVAALVAADYISSRVVPDEANTRYLSGTPQSTHDLMSGTGAGAIRKNADSAIRKNAERVAVKMRGGLSAKMPSHPIIVQEGIVQGESPPAPLSEKDERKKLKNIAHSRKLEPEEKSRFSYLNSKKECPFLPGEFFKFFVDQVLGRFDKYTITTVVLADWHRQLFEKFGVDIAIAAVSDHAATKKGTGWQPSFATVVKIAQGIDVEQKRIAAGKIAAKKRADDELQKKTDAENNLKEKPRPPVKEMTADELVEWRAIYVGLNNNMMIIAIDKETGNRNRKLVAVGE